MQAIREWIEDSQQYKRKHGLRRMELLLELLNNPQKKVSMIHVTGTNGKGSTIAMLMSLFKHHQFRVGAFVSPHLIDYTDRFLLNGEAMTSDIFESIAVQVQQAEQQLVNQYGHLSFFEVMTAIAFVYFAQEMVDVALIEVGIGGLLDTTNVIHSDVSVITSVGLDHQEMLGDSEEAIAIQKTGIIKPHQVVVLGKVAPLVQEVTKIVADTYESKLLIAEENFDLRITKEQEYQFTNQAVVVRFPKLGLAGGYQVDNAAVALQAFLSWMEMQQQLWANEAIQQAMAVVTWPGRMEIMSEQPLIFLDGAHNLHAMKRLVENVRLKQQDSPQTILFSALKRKQYLEMLAYLHQELPNVKIRVTQFDFPGSIEKDDVSNETFIANYREFITHFKQSGELNEQLWVTGSLYFLSEVRQFLLES